MAVMSSALLRHPVPQRAAAARRTPRSANGRIWRIQSAGRHEGALSLASTPLSWKWVPCSLIGRVGLSGPFLHHVGGWIICCAPGLRDCTAPPGQAVLSPPGRYPLPVVAQASIVATVSLPQTVPTRQTWLNLSPCPGPFAEATVRGSPGVEEQTKTVQPSPRELRGSDNWASEWSAGGVLAGMACPCAPPAALAAGWGMAARVRLSAVLGAEPWFRTRANGLATEQQHMSEATGGAPSPALFQASLEGTRPCAPLQVLPIPCTGGPPPPPTPPAGHGSSSQPPRPPPHPTDSKPLDSAEAVFELHSMPCRHAPSRHHAHTATCQLRELGAVQVAPKCRPFPRMPARPLCAGLIPEEGEGGQLTGVLHADLRRTIVTYGELAQVGPHHLGNCGGREAWGLSSPCDTSTGLTAVKGGCFWTQGGQVWAVAVLMRALSARPCNC